MKTQATMRKNFSKLFFFLLFALITFTACNNSTTSEEKNKNSTSGGKKQNADYAEGSDYLLFQRVRLTDNMGFTQPEEAYSILLPRGWQHESEIIWNTPGTSCEGTFKKMKASSADGKYNFEIMPDLIFIWNTDPQLMQFYRNNSINSPYCKIDKPINAEDYLRNVFVPEELDNASIIKVEPNSYVVQQMKQSNEASRQEMMQYGAGRLDFDQTAVNATVRWPDGKEGLVTLGVTIIATAIPNVYNGSYNTVYTTQITQRTVFTYPQDKAEEAKNQFSVIMSSFRTNPNWINAVNKFWKNVREKKQQVHIGKIQAMDAQTRQMGEDAIKKGQQRLNDMDNEMRSWEASQATDDKIHTNFIKAIREVENYSDASGTYELSSSYDHAWSRGDGTSFVMSNNPNFDPAFVFQDEQWNEMKRVD
jgi:hypothetical protein